ncbi:InlB B-repeat-containing protein, partial [Eggerthella guodeyinii]
MSASEPDAKAPDVAGDAYEVGDDAGFAAAKAAIETSDAAEAIIEFTADNVNVGGFAGVAGKRVTLRSAEGQKFTLAGMGTDLVGDLTLDNVRCWGVNTKVFANGHRFETTEGFEGTGGKAVASLYGGGSRGNDVAGGTSLVLRGGSFSFVHGGGFDSDVAGSASVTIDGASAHVGSLFGGGHAFATDRGRVGGDVEVAVLRGTNGMLFGGGQNEWSADSREPAAVSGGVHVSIGYEGAPAGSVRTGTAMYTYGGSWHSTVGSVLLELLEGSTNASTSGDRNYFGCGYRDTVRGTVKVVVDGSDLNEDGHVYGGGNEDAGNMGDAYGPVRILNEGGEPHALEMSYRSASDNVDGGMNAGSNGEIPTEIGGDVLLRMEDGNIAFAILDNEDFGHCTIDGDATIEVGGGRIAQIQGNKNHGSGDAFGSRLVYDGCGSADAPQESGYLYLFRDVQLVNGANVLIDSERFSQFSKIQKPILSKPDLSINGTSVLTTRDSETSVLNVSVDDGTWHALGRVYVYEGVTSRDGHYFWDKYYAVGYNHKGDGDPSGFDAYRGERDEFVGSKEGTFVSKFYGNVVLDRCDVAFMGPVNVSGGFSGGDSLMRLPVTTDDNYTGGADSPSIPVNIDGAATGSCSVLAVDAADRLVPAAPALGDNYVTGWKADGASDEAFVLANDDDATVAGGLYLKRVEDPAATDGGYYMWQIAAKRTVTFDENGGDTKADPPVCDIPLVAGQTEYHATLPATEPTRVGYDFAGWSAEVDDPALAHEFTAASQVDRSMTVYAQWKARSDTAFRVEHYQVSVDGASARLVRAEDNVGATGAEAVARPISIPGCTYRPAFDQNGMITASS